MLPDADFLNCAIKTHHPTREAAQAARELLIQARGHIAYPCFEIDEMERTLAELDEGKV